MVVLHRAGDCGLGVHGRHFSQGPPVKSSGQGVAHEAVLQVGAVGAQAGAGPIVLVWDNLNTHLTAGMRRYIAERDWLTVYQLPTYAPDLNPVESIWSILRRTTMANRAFTDPNDLITTVRQGLRRLQYRHDVLDGCLLGTGLVPAPP
ncbi:transposase [Sphaerisporangium fuscum]|uniref:transposase n=1 Tax=Sphaerisporangium fuscum TaxID=2835868 RepID=UPI001BDC3DCB|nr:transposase [Sphaerisporangium fuscum]